MRFEVGDAVYVTMPIVREVPAGTYGVIAARCSCLASRAGGVTSRNFAMYQVASDKGFHCFPSFALKLIDDDGAIDELRRPVDWNDIPFANHFKKDKVT
jgi:hypothetical protein